MDSILRDLKLKSILLKFAKSKPENVSKLSNEELSCLCLITVVIICVPCAITKKQHQSAAAAALSS